MQGCQMTHVTAAHSAVHFAYAVVTFVPLHSPLLYSLEAAKMLCATCNTFDDS